MVDTVIINKPSATEEPAGHQEAMIAKVDAANAAAPSPETTRPGWLPEKFKTVEDMAQAYAALEAKQSQGQKPVETPATPEVTPPVPPVDQVETDLKIAGLKMEDFTAEFNQKGELSTESYDKLLAAGYDKNLVDGYIAGQKAIATQFESSVLAEAGGTESYSEMVNWAKVNMSTEEQTVYNAAVSSGNLAQAKLAVAGLKSRFSADNGNEPNLLGGRAAASEDTFESVAQVTAAMKDPRYQSDSAYRAGVQKKLGRSNVF